MGAYLLSIVSKYKNVFDSSEPNFSKLKKGSRILAKIADSRIWQTKVIEEISDETCLVKHDKALVPVPLHNVLPLGDGKI